MMNARNKNEAHAKPEIIRLNGKPHTVIEKITSGMTAIVYRTNDGGVIKRLKRRTPQTIEIFERELLWLETLRDAGIVPRVLDSDRDASMLLMEDAGNPITRENIPADWREQLERMLKIFGKFHCWHNDLSEQELLVKNGRIRVIDFGFASYDTDITCGGRFRISEKNRLFDDRYITELVELTAGHGIPHAEPHCFVLWDTGERKKVEEAIAERFRIVRAITYSPGALKLLGRHRLEILSRFYHGRISYHGEKGKTPFVLFVVFDENPRYEMRRNPFNGEERVVNVNTFDLLQRLRKGKTSFLHGSDNIQESYDNLETLTFYGGRDPLRCWEAWRPRFDSTSDFFAALNSTQGLRYVVLRNFEDLLNDTPPSPSADIDMLVNDYDLFKRITGAIGYKHKRSKRHPHGGQAVEYGGYKVAGNVSIGGQEISVDIRFVGDNYYDPKWANDILTRRIPIGGAFVPGSKDAFYSLLYHALVHKRAFSDRYRLRLTRQAKELGILDGSVDAMNDAAAWSLLDSFMKQEGYAYVRPNELTIPFAARERAGISIRDDLNEARAMLGAGKHLDAHHLLKQAVRDAPFNIPARLRLLESEARLILQSCFGVDLRLLLLVIKDSFKDNASK